MIDETHDPALKSWVESANRPGCGFPIQNLPLGVFRTESDSAARLGVAIGDFVLDASPWLSGNSLNVFMELPASERRDLRRALSEALAAGAPTREVIPQTECEMLLPAAVGDFTDFYASLHHGTNVGRLFRPDKPLLPNYKQVPIAYGGRASSLVVSGSPVYRPSGQLGPGQFGPTAELDYELEIGIFIGPGNRGGEAISVDEAEDHIAGICLLNDWSARDIQRWEYQPLGPFLAKNFATSISPWIVTFEALAPFLIYAALHDEPALAYLAQTAPGALDITAEVLLSSSSMPHPTPISKSYFRDMFWTPAQMIAHHTSNGCRLRPGDLIGSGTISGPERINRGCLLELTEGGRDPLVLPCGETRTFLKDGDEVFLTGYCEREGFVRIGLGVCSGTVIPAYKS